MASRLLTDEQISNVVAEHVRARRPDIGIVALRPWRGGILEGQPDDLVLEAAAQEGLTLVTYDRHSIGPLLGERGRIGLPHGGVVFIDERTIARRNIGGQAVALIQLWDQTPEWDWRNVVVYLRPARQSHSSP